MEGRLERYRQRRRRKDRMSIREAEEMKFSRRRKWSTVSNTVETQ
jgi:hypothetical protein